MISVSTIKSYMFCPLKLYFQSNIDEDIEEDYFISKTLKDLRIDIQDILHKNLRHIKKDMDEKEIEKRLSIGISNQVKTTFEIIEEINDKEEIDESNLKKDEEIEFIDEEKKDDENDNLKELKKELINEINLNIKILSLKVAQSMKVLDKDGHEIQNLFFPTSMYNYLIRDIGLDLIGVIDKIEVEKGNYLPISLKSSNPPITGVWDGDFMEAIANALLIEQEFNTYVTVAYIDYLKIADRRAVIIDTDARKSFFKVLTSVNKIVENGEIPTVKTGLKKCENCEYKELCDNS
ncbi:Dna2/Cas4 domain-containing protein [Methanobrevibacter ruminantium]|uniref:CRISPR-associated protein Cas4 n=1 Tax=Methanobrevibacter ruminantium TaxID=83816 RepID=UPI0026F35576|nr:Dna2/Cas4 domain-containing protein [Methanobrevibacter ruminantium]MCI5737628.1 Dna2/Cas4 domain-containing protein [Methanobrevibacter ruminantium]